MNSIVKFQEPRLPYHEAIEQRYGIDRSGWKALTEAVFPSAKTVDSVVMALSYCRARKLDPFKRPVHIVPMWNATERKMVETVWPGVSEIRTTAFRTGQFAGMDAAAFGPDDEQEFYGKDDKGNERRTNVSFPEWCQITVWRVLHGQRCSFVGPRVYWRESYGRWKNTDVPNDMWAKRPSGQLEKCAEAAALRRAFPEEVGNEYAAEEMEGQRIIADQEVTPIRRAPSPDAPVVEQEAAPTAPPRALPPEPPTPVQESEQGSAQVTQRRAPPPPIAELEDATAEDVVDPDKIRARFEEAARKARDEDELGTAWAEIVEPFADKMFPGDLSDCDRIYRIKKGEFEG